MFDELAEAEMRERLAQLESLVHRKDERIGEMEKAEALVQELQAQKGQWADMVKEREAELSYISKELTEREREIAQLKDLTAHLESRAAERSAQFDAEKRDICAQYETERDGLRLEVADMQKRVDGLQAVVAELRIRESELVESRTRIVEDYESRLTDLSYRIEILQARDHDQAEARSRFDSVQAALEQVQGLNREFEAQIRMQADEIGRLNESLAAAQADLGRLSAELRQIADEAVQRQVEVEGTLADERTEWRQAEQGYRHRLLDLETQVDSLRAEVAVAEGIRVEAAGLRVSLQEAQSRLNQLEEAARAAQKERDDVRQQLEQKVDEMRAFQDRMGSAEGMDSQVNRLVQDLRDKEREAEEWHRRLDAAAAEVQSLEARLRDMVAGTDESEAQLRTENEELSRIHQEWMEVATGRITDLETENRRIAADLGTRDSRIRDLELTELDLAQSQKTLSTLEAALSQEERAISELIQRNLQAQQDLTDRTTALDSARAQIVQLQNALREAETSNQGLQARNAVLEQELGRTGQRLGETEARLAQAESTFQSFDREAWEQDLMEVQQQLAAAMAQAELFSRENHEARKRLEASLASLSERDTLLAEKDGLVGQLRREVEKAAGDLTVRDQELESVRQQAALLEETVSSVTEQLRLSRARGEELESALAEETLKAADLASRSEGQHETISHLESQLDETRRSGLESASRSESERVELRNSRDALQGQLEALRFSYNQLDEDLKRTSGSLDSARTEVMDYEQRLADRETLVQSQGQKLEELQNDLIDARSSRREDRRRFERFRNRSLLAHVAAGMLVVAVFLFSSRGPDTGNPESGVGGMETVNKDGSLGETSSPGTVVREELSIPAPASSGHTSPPVESRPAPPTREGQPAPAPVEEAQGMASAIPEIQEAVPSRVYTIQKGDNLWNICKRELGDPSLWREVLMANSLSEDQAKRLKPGDQIVLNVTKPRSHR